MEYQPDKCGYCQAETWCEYRTDAETGEQKPQCRACKVVRFFENLLYPPLGFSLLQWQERDLRAVYGPVDRDDGRRRIRTAYRSMGKKNGKSFFVAGIPIYHLTCEVDLEPMPLEAFGGAAAKEQAGIVFRAAKRLVDVNPALRSLLRVIPSTKRIVRRDGRGYYAVVSGDGDLQDGCEPSLVIKDELHRWKTPKAAINHVVLSKGTKSRREPIEWIITTRGEEYECPLWEEEDDYAQHIIDGSIENDRYYAAIDSADVDKLANDDEYWKSREARLAANPSHEYHGGFLKDEDFLDDIKRAQEHPGKKSDFLRYNLNVKINSTETRAINMDRWRQNAGAVDLREWPEYDVGLLIRKWGLLDRPCYAGLDLSAEIDLTAVTFVFPPFEEIEQWTLLPFVWMPAGQVKKRTAKDRVPYATWVHQKFIETVPGEVIENGPIKDRLRWGQQMFDLRELCFDPWNARDLVNELTDDGFTCVKIEQTIRGLSEPTKRLLALCLDRKLRHGNNPVLNFCASCLATVADKNDNVKPAKPDRSKSGKRIDPISAAITGMARAIVATDVEAGAVFV